MSEASSEENKNSRDRVSADIHQVKESLESMDSLAKQNVEACSTLSHTMELFTNEMDAAYSNYDRVLEGIRKQLQDTMDLVEENKHFTTPSKYLSEFGESLHQDYQAYEQSLEKMTGLGKQMGVLALNAAIEAGRLGEAGKDFVSSAEEIRSFANNYQDEIDVLEEQVKKSEERVEELEKQVNLLVSHLKESNVCATRLMKSTSESVKQMEESGIRDISEDMKLMRDVVISSRNSDEEIVKAKERCMIQLTDTEEELQLQGKNEDEMKRIFNSVYERLSNDND
ncbi:MAG: methyl-accepting chemotaxis protein [Agathobacter sp.]|nr:methyl-accepting chemotaxis protein [Agathobacter sp.]